MFDFGRNWQDYSNHALNDQSLQSAEDSLRDLLKVDSLSGCSMLDLGCGSGLFSIAAVRLGARVVAADINPLCLEVTRNNAARFLGDSAQLSTRLLSVLDRAALEACGTFDIVYSWGVLPFTGAMWQAIENTFLAVKPGGQLVFSIYNKHFTSPIWRVIKWTYGHLPGWGQRIMARLFAGVIYVAKLLVTRQNPLKKERGMSFWHDVVDWMGGYPYEYATIDEVTRFVTARNFKMLRVIPARVPTGCNEFVCVRTNFENPNR
jgi:SAM-dependent methyltransferase